MLWNLKFYLLDYRVLRRADHEPLVGLVSLQFRVKGDPDF